MVAGVVAQENVVGPGGVVHRRHTSLSAVTRGPRRDSGRPWPNIPAAEVEPLRAELPFDVLRSLKVNVDVKFLFILPFGTILSSRRLPLYGTVCSPVKGTATWTYDPQERHNQIEHNISGHDA
jgi:hypothetical protein